MQSNRRRGGASSQPATRRGVLLTAVAVVLLVCAFAVSQTKTHPSEDSHHGHMQEWEPVPDPKLDETPAWEATTTPKKKKKHVAETNKRPSKYSLWVRGQKRTPRPSAPAAEHEERPRKVDQDEHDLIRKDRTPRPVPASPADDHLTADDVRERREKAAEKTAQAKADGREGRPDVKDENGAGTANEEPKKETTQDQRAKEKKEADNEKKVEKEEKDKDAQPDEQQQADPREGKDADRAALKRDLAHDAAETATSKRRERVAVSVFIPHTHSSAGSRYTDEVHKMLYPSWVWSILHRDTENAVAQNREVDLLFFVQPEAVGQMPKQCVVLDSEGPMDTAVAERYFAEASNLLKAKKGSTTGRDVQEDDQPAATDGEARGGDVKADGAEATVKKGKVKKAGGDDARRPEKEGEQGAAEKAAVEDADNEKAKVNPEFEAYVAAMKYAKARQPYDRFESKFEKLSEASYYAEIARGAAIAEQWERLMDSSVPVATAANLVSGELPKGRDSKRDLQEAAQDGENADEKPQKADGETRASNSEKKTVRGWQRSHCIVIPERARKPVDWVARGNAFMLSLEVPAAPRHQRVQERYAKILRSDGDVFVVPALFSWKPKSAFITGGGWYSSMDYTQERLKGIATKLGLSHDGVHNVGSTWFAAPRAVVRVLKVALFTADHIIKHESGGPRSWPKWWPGVTSLYAGEIATNYMLGKEGFVKMPDTLDGHSHRDDRGSVSKVVHIHCWQTQGNPRFAKFDYWAGKYKRDQFPVSSLDLTTLRDYATFMALHFWEMTSASKHKELKRYTIAPAVPEE